MRAKRRSSLVGSWVVWVGVCVVVSGCTSPLKRAQSFLAEGRKEDALRVLEAGLARRSEDPALTLALAETALEVGDLTRAARASERAVLLLPQSAQAHLVRATVLLNTGDTYQAAIFLEKARTLGGEPSSLLVGHFARLAPRAARSLLEEGKPGEAARVLFLLDALSPDLAPPALFAQIFLERASLRAREGDLEGAAKDYLAAATRRGPLQAAEPYLEAGVLLLRLGKLSEADEAFLHARQAVEASGGDLRAITREIAERYQEWGETGRAARVWAELAGQGGEGNSGAWYEAGKLFSLSGNKEQAEEAFSQYIAAYPGDRKIIAVREVAKFYKGQGDWERAEKYYRLAITYAPDDIRDHRDLANLLAEQGRFDLVEEIFSSYIEVIRSKSKEKVGWAYREIARWYEGKERDEEALRAFLAAAKEGYQAELDLAEVYGRLKRFPEMIAALDRYIEAEQDKRRATLTAARTLLSAGEITGAQKYARRVFTSDPSRRDAAFLLASILFAQSDLAGEEKVLSSYAAAQKSPAYGWFEVGKHYMRRNDIARAQKAFGVSVEKGSREAALALGDLHLGQNNLQKAKEAFRRYLDSAPDRHRALETVLDHYRKNPVYRNERIAILEEMLKLRPTLTSWALVLGREYLDAGELQKALDVFAVYVQASSDRAEAWRAVGNRLKDGGYPELAEEAYDKALAVYPDSGEGLWAKGKLSLLLHREGQAAAFFRAYLDSPGDKSPRALLEAAGALREKGLYEVTLLLYQEALARDPSRSDVLLHMGEYALRLGEIKTAEEAFALYLTKHHQEPGAQLEIGRIYKNERYYDKAAPYLKAALSLPLERFRVFPDLVDCLKKAGRWEEIPEVSSLLLTLARGDAERYDAHSLVADAYGALGKAKERIYHLERALRYRPNSADDLYHKIADTLVSIGDYKRAEEYILRAAKLNRDPADALFRAAVSWEKQKEPGLARKLYLASAEYGGNFEEDARIAAGKLLFVLKDPTSGLSELQEAARRSPRAADTWEKAALALLSIGESAFAAKAYGEALLEDPTPRAATLALARLLFAQGDSSEAQRLLEEYVTRNSAGPGKSIIEVARVYAEGDMIDKALAYYRQALRGSNAKEARQAYSEARALLLARGDTEGLLSLSRELTLLSEVEPHLALLDAGRAFAEAGLMEEARQSLREVLALGKGGQETLLSAAVLLAELGEQEEAWQAILALGERAKDPAALLLKAAARTPPRFALLLLEEVARRAPKRSLVWRTRGEILLGQGEIAEAVWALSRAVELAADPGEEAERAYQLLVSSNATAEAELFINLITDPSAALFARALSFLARGDTKKAKEALTAYIARRPPGEGVKKAGEAALRLGQAALAEELLRGTAKRLAEPDIVSLWLSAHLASGKEEGFSFLTTLPKAEARPSALREKLVEDLLARGESEAALPLAQALFQESPHSWERFRLFFAALSATGLAAGSDWEGEAFQAALSFAAARPVERGRSLQSAADLATRAGFSSLAARLLKEALKASPRSPEIALALGKALLAEGDEAGAREAFLLAQTHALKPRAILQEIGDAYASMLLPAQAAAAYEEALRTQPATSSLLASLGEARLLGGDRPGGLEALRQAVQKTPDPARAAARYALHVLEILGAEGVEIALALLEGQEPLPEVREAYAIARLMNGEGEAARDLAAISLDALRVLPKPALRLALKTAPDTLRALAGKGFKETLAVAKAARDAGETDFAVSLLSEAWKDANESPLLYRQEEGARKDTLTAALAIALIDDEEAGLGLLSSRGLGLLSQPEGALAAAYAAIKSQKPEARRLARLVALLSARPERAAYAGFGQAAYAALFSHALAQGKKSFAREVAEEMRRLAIAGGLDVGPSLFCLALLAEGDLSLWRQVLAQGDPALTGKVRLRLAGEEVFLPLPWP